MGDSRAPPPALCSGLLTEVKCLWALCWPVMFTFILEYLPPMITLGIIGHTQPKDVVSGVALSTMFLNIFGRPVIIGLGLGMNTLASQSFGRQDVFMIGAYTQQGLVVCYLSLVPIALAGFYAMPILQAFGQPQAVLVYAAPYIRILLLSMPPFAVYIIGKKALQCQNNVRPGLYCALLGNLTNAVSCYLCLVTFRLPYLAAAACTVASYFAMAVPLCVYIFCCGNHRVWWPGWAWRHVTPAKLATYCRYGLPGMVRVLAMLWVFEGVALLAGLLPNPVVAIAANAAVVNFNTVVFMPMLGSSAAASIRVGQFMGACDAQSARRATLVGALITFCFAFSASMLVLALRNTWPLLFLTEPSLVEAAASVSPVLVVMLYSDGFNAFTGSILQGLGRQAVSPFISILTIYPVGLPMAWFFGFKLSLGVAGLYWGIVLALSACVLVTSAYIYCCDWDRIALDASRGATLAGVSAMADGIASPLCTPLQSMPTPPPTAAAGMHSSGSGGGGAAGVPLLSGMATADE